MGDPCETEITALLERARTGDARAAGELAAAVEPYLRRVAAAQLQRNPDSVLESGALLNEAWLRLCGESYGHFNDRAHFVRAAARTMRLILVDRARAKTTEKRGGGGAKRLIQENDAVAEPAVLELVALDEALRKLDADERDLADLRLFGGLSAAEIARLRACSKRTVERQWAELSARLRGALGED